MGKHEALQINLFAKEASRMKRRSTIVSASASTLAAHGGRAAGAPCCTCWSVQPSVQLLPSWQQSCAKITTTLTDRTARVYGVATTPTDRRARVYGVATTPTDRSVLGRSVSKGNTGL
eukprot:352835-Chlamydomonas_euryale.AAC.8